MANKILTGGLVTVAMVNAFSLYSTPSDKDGNSEVRRPNFIIIMADDMGYGDISTFGNNYIKTPNLDKMASEGMILSDFHSNGAVSSPTRCALLTGRYQQRAGLDGVLLTNVPKLRLAGLQPEETTFADVLSANGYEVAMFGKWHLGYLPKYSPLNHGFSTFEGFLAGNVDYKAFLDSQGRPDWYEGNEQKTPHGYLTEIINDKSVEFIKKEHSKPFCLYVAHGCPHSPYQGPNSPAFRSIGSNKMQIPEGQNDTVAYKEMIENLDTGIGEIFNALKETGLDNNTFVIFLSDNGPTGPGSAGMLRGGKGTVFEGGHRVPAIVRMPGKIKPGTKNNTPLMTMDIFPTMLHIADIEYDDSGKPLDGKSFFPVIAGEKAMEERPLFWKYRDQRAVRLGNMKYVESAVGKGSNRKIKKFLFNLDNDFSEQRNIIDTYPNKAAKMKAMLDKWDKEVCSETPEQTL